MGNLLRSALAFRSEDSAALARFLPVGPFEKPLDEVPLPLDLFLDFPPLAGPFGL